MNETHDFLSANFLRTVDIRIPFRWRLGGIFFYLGSLPNQTIIEIRHYILLIAIYVHNADFNYLKGMYDMFCHTAELPLF